jgi:hypothetical protein
MKQNEAKYMGSVRFGGSMFLPKYEEIIQELYQKAAGLDSKTQLESRIIPTIESLSRSKIVLKKREY